jgi:hypothetical protein
LRKTMDKERRERLKRYLIRKLEGFGCPDSLLDQTAETMVESIIRIVER